MSDNEFEKSFTIGKLDMEMDGSGTLGIAVPSNILTEALKVTEDRQEKYGPPNENFKRIAELWTAYLNTDINFTERDVAMMMVLLKIARDVHSAQRDNLVDIAGYARTVEMLNE
jgi:hypothetical protein